MSKSFNLVIFCIMLLFRMASNLRLDSTVISCHETCSACQRAYDWWEPGDLSNDVHCVFCNECFARKTGQFTTYRREEPRNNDTNNMARFLMISNEQIGFPRGCPRPSECPEDYPLEVRLKCPPIRPCKRRSAGQDSFIFARKFTGFTPFARATAPWPGKTAESVDAPTSTLPTDHITVADNPYGGPEIPEHRFNTDALPQSQPPDEALEKEDGTTTGDTYSPNEMNPQQLMENMMQKTPTLDEMKKDESVTDTILQNPVEQNSQDLLMPFEMTKKQNQEKSLPSPKNAEEYNINDKLYGITMDDGSNGKQQKGFNTPSNFMQDFSMAGSMPKSGPKNVIYVPPKPKMLINGDGRTNGNVRKPIPLSRATLSSNYGSDKVVPPYGISLSEFHLNGNAMMDKPENAHEPMSPDKPNIFPMKDDKNIMAEEFATKNNAADRDTPNEQQIIENIMPIRPNPPLQPFPGGQNSNSEGNQYASENLMQGNLSPYGKPKENGMQDKTYDKGNFYSVNEVRHGEKYLDEQAPDQRYINSDTGDPFADRDNLRPQLYFESGRQAEDTTEPVEEPAAQYKTLQPDAGASNCCPSCFCSMPMCMMGACPNAGAWPQQQQNYEMQDYPGIKGKKQELEYATVAPTSSTTDISLNAVRRRKEVKYRRKNGALYVGIPIIN